jgi:hypothetical protein
MRRLAFGVALSMAAVGALSAAGFWETKPFATWSDKELQEVLTDSPWSRTVNVVLNTVGRAGGGDAEGAGGGARGGGGGGGIDNDGGGGGGRRAGSRGGGYPVVPPQLKLLVSWRSAQPMKQAAVRNQVGMGGAVPEEMQQALERTEPIYVVTLSGLPVRYQRMLGDMKAGTFLKRGKQAAIAATEAGAQQTAAGIVVVFGFPKEDAITIDDKEIEFVTRLGTFDIKKKFGLKDMVFHGKLEL